MASDTFANAMDDDFMRLAAALAFYTALSLAPLVLVLDSPWPRCSSPAEGTQREILRWVREDRGPPRGGRPRAGSSRPSKTDGGSGWAAAVGIATLLLGATAVFANLQDSLNIIWRMKPKPSNEIWGWVKKRLVSVAIVLGIGLMLGLSLAATSVMTVMQSHLGGLPGSEVLWRVGNVVVGLGIYTLLFALMYYHLPDAEIRWGDVWIGAFATAVLFTVGKELISLYLGYASVGTRYGAAGSFVLLLIFIYYSSICIFLGAEFTEVYADAGARTSSRRNTPCASSAARSKRSRHDSVHRTLHHHSWPVAGRPGRGAQPRQARHRGDRRRRGRSDAGCLSKYTRATFRYRSPGTDPEGFLEDMLAAVETHAPASGPYVLMPMHREAYALARARDRFPAELILPLPDAELMDRVRHKGRLVGIARDMGIRAPDTWLPRSDADIDDVAARASYPAFVKPPTGVAGTGISKVNTPAELAAAVRALVNEDQPDPEDWPLVQQAVPGDDVCVAVLFDQGKNVASFAYKNVATFPRDKGPGAVRQGIIAKGLEDTAARLMGGLGWHGIAEVDFRWTGQADDEGYLIEVNPRFFSGLGHVVAAGADLPWLLWCVATGKELPPSVVDQEMRTEMPVVGWLATLADVAESEANLDELEVAWREAGSKARGGSLLEAGKRLLLGLEELDLAGRLERLKERLAESDETRSVLYDPDDPLPVLGLMYPLALFLRHGKITEEILSGADRE